MVVKSSSSWSVSILVSNLDLWMVGSVGVVGLAMGSQEVREPVAVHLSSGVFFVRFRLKRAVAVFLRSEQVSHLHHFLQSQFFLIS